MYEPQPHDLVTIGRHGAPMTVTKVFPISRAAVVVANDGDRFVVDWHEMTDTEWTIAVRELDEEIDRYLDDSMNGVTL